MDEQINKKILENENYLNENKSKLIKILKNIRNLKISITTFTLAIVLVFTIPLILYAGYEIILIPPVIILSFFCIISILVKRRLVIFLLSFFSFVFIIYSIFLLFASELFIFFT